MFEIAIIDFLQKYFFSGYTIFNTLVYGIILAIFLFLVIKLFDKFKINPIDLLCPLIPFIVLGSGVRALVDNGIYHYSWFLITPGIYFIVAIAASLSLIIGIAIQEMTGLNYRYFVFVVGSILAIVNLINVPHLNFTTILLVIATWLIVSSFFVAIGRFLSIYKNKINLSIISAHIFDASSTFIAVDFYSYSEQHVVPNLFYNIFGTAVTVFFLKIFVITVGLYLIDKYIDNESTSGTVKLAIFILGLAPGVRNFLTLAIGSL